MSRIPVWSLFAFKNDDEDCSEDERRKVTDWQVADTIAWCRHRGYDVIMLQRLDETAAYEKQPPPDQITHHMH